MIQIKWAELNYTQFDRRGIRSAMGKAARIMARQMKQVVGGSGSGTQYRRGGRVYTASAPGAPPARFSGNLFRSMQGRASRRGYALVVSAVAPHAALLELGTGRMDPRPAFEPTFSQAGFVVDLLRAAYANGVVGTPGQPGAAPAVVEIN
jgi:hypothetical protein